MTENGMNLPIDLETAKERVMGDLEFLREMLDEFEASIPAHLQSIRDAIEQKDATTLSKTAHQFKGVALNLSVLQIAEKAAALDELGRTADFEKAVVGLNDLEFAVSAFKVFMEKETW